MLTGERINIDLPHIDGNITQPRNTTIHDLNEISIFPNPVSGEKFDIIINAYEANSKYRYEMINSNGKLLTNGVLMSANKSLPINMPSGLYLIKIYKNGELIQFDKLIKF